MIVCMIFPDDMRLVGGGEGVLMYTVRNGQGSVVRKVNIAIHRISMIFSNILNMFSNW